MKRKAEERNREILLFPIRLAKPDTEAIGYTSGHVCVGVEEKELTMETRREEYVQESLVSDR